MDTSPFQFFTRSTSAAPAGRPVSFVPPEVLPGSAPSQPGPAGAAPLVSVIVPVFNAARTLERAIASAAGQSLRDIEIIAWDDGSTDSSLALLRRLAGAEPRLRVFAGGVNQGPGAARNAALGLARGDWIAILDADDWYAPERLQTLLDLAQASGADLVADNQYFYDAAAQRVIGAALGPRHGARALTVADLIGNAMTGRSAYDFGLLQPVIRRALLERHAIRYPTAHRYGEDFVFVLDCLTAGARGMLSLRPMYYVTQPHGALSRRAPQQRRSYDFRDMRRSNDVAMDHCRGQIGARELTLLERRGRSIELYARYLERKDRPWLAARLLGVLREPALWPYAWRALARHAAAWRAYVGRPWG